MQTTTRLVAVLFAFSIAGAACSSGGSGVSSSKPLSDFTQEDADKFCAYVDDVYADLDDDFLKIYCYAFSSFFAEGEECEMLAQECIEEGFDEEEEEEFECELGDLPECASEVTAGELEDCLEEEADDVESFARTVNCDTDFEQDLPLTPACQRIEDKCPGFFGD